MRLSGDRILATPTGRNKLLLKAADMIVGDMDGLSEELTREVVIHSHPPIATGVAVQAELSMKLFVLRRL